MYGLYIVLRWVAFSFMACIIIIDEHLGCFQFKITNDTVMNA